MTDRLLVLLAVRIAGLGVCRVAVDQHDELVVVKHLLVLLMRRLREVLGVVLML